MLLVALLLVSCSRSPIEDWPVGVDYGADVLIIDGNEFPEELASTFEIRRTSAEEATFSAFGCSYGYGPMVIEDGRLVGVDLTLTLDNCVSSEPDLYFALREQLFFGGEPQISHDDGELILENNEMRAVLSPTETAS